MLKLNYKISYSKARGHENLIYFSNNFDINELDIEPFSLKIHNNRYDNHSQIETVKMPKLRPEDVQDFTVSRRFFLD